jgi:acetaldehyde dehydrogenase (acetylating)
MTNEEAMFKSMRKKAAELGANAVILDAVTEPSTGGKVASAIFGVGGERKGKALAIYVFPARADTTMRDTVRDTVRDTAARRP